METHVELVEEPPYLFPQFGCLLCVEFLLHIPQGFLRSHGCVITDEEGELFLLQEGSLQDIQAIFTVLELRREEEDIVVIVQCGEAIKRSGLCFNIKTIFPCKGFPL